MHHLRTGIIGDQEGSDPELSEPLVFLHPVAIAKFSEHKKVICI